MTSTDDFTRPFSTGGEDGGADLALFARLREHCPVAHTGDGGGHWGLFRHDDVLAAARDPEGFVNSGYLRFDPARRRPPLESDPPEHTEIRRLLNPFFMPRRLRAKLEPVSRDIASTCVDRLVEARGGDGVAELARPLPPQVLLSLLNQPRADWVRIKAWAEDAYLQGASDAESLARFRAADQGLWEYARAILADRKQVPRDPTDDPASAMLAASVGGKPLDEALIVGTLRLLLGAGHDSTTSTLGMMIHHLAVHRADQERLRAEPALIAPAMEELLRLKTPVVSMPRMAARDTTIHGRAIRRGEVVRLYYAAANRDPRAFERAEECVLDRAPNRHVAFGYGIHMCIGAPLARQEVSVAVDELLRRTRHFTLAGPVDFQFWHRSGPRILPITLDPR
jgi:cytochrome P450